VKCRDAGEIRSPKSEVRKKSELRTSKNPPKGEMVRISAFGLLSDFGFRTSDFGFRISDFEKLGRAFPMAFATVG